MIREEKLARPYIDRLRNDPRTRAIMDGMISQALVEAENLYGVGDNRAAMAFAARRGIQFAMSFVLDHDREYHDVLHMLDNMLANRLLYADLQPRQITIPAHGFAASIGSRQGEQG